MAVVETTTTIKASNDLAEAIRITFGRGAQYSSRRNKMKLTLSLMAAAFGSTAFFAAPVAALIPQSFAVAEQNATEMPLLDVEAEIDVASWLFFTSDGDDDDDDDDDHDDDDDCDDDGVDDCFGDAANQSQTGATTPPANGLFSPGSTPQVQSN
jgi:hypothetical protein